MPVKGLVVLIVLILILTASGLAQRNEVSGTIGRIFIPTQTVQGSDYFNPNVHFGNGLSFALNYGRALKAPHGVGLSLELPVMVTPDEKLNTGANVIPSSYKAFFVTPSARVNFFYGQGISPWISFGGGFAHFKESGHLIYGDPNPNKTSNNAGALQAGTGLDVWPWQAWGLRLEARDFYSGVPNLNITTNRIRQHNFYVGGGVIYRF